MDRFLKGISWQGVAVLGIFAASGTLIAIFGQGEMMGHIRDILFGLAGGTLMPTPWRGGQKKEEEVDDA